MSRSAKPSTHSSTRAMISNCPAVSSPRLATAARDCSKCRRAFGPIDAPGGASSAQGCRFHAPRERRAMTVSASRQSDGISSSGTISSLIIASSISSTSSSLLRT